MILIYFVHIIAAVLQGFDYPVDMVMVVGFHRNIQGHLLEAVGYLGLVVVQLDDVGIGFRQYLGYIQQLAWFVRQLYRETEHPATGDKGLVYQG